jgi:hypothetical protein
MADTARAALSMRVPTVVFAGSPKRCESLIRFSILRRMTSIALTQKANIAQAEGDLPRASAILALLHPPPLLAKGSLRSCDDC